MANETITKIEPGRSWLSIGLSDLWTYRELLFFLTLRDVMVRYKQTAIGVIWVVLQPVATTVVFAVIFSQVARLDSADVPYPLYVLSGVLIWLFVYNAVTFASNSLVGNSNLVTKIYFPRLIVPMAAVIAAIVDLVIGFLVLVAAMFYFGAAPSIRILTAPLFIAQAFVLAAAIGILFAALNVRFRDVKFALPFGLQVWMFVSPIFYPMSILPEKARFVFAFNPLTGILEGFRAALFGGPYDMTAILISIGATIGLLALGLFVFGKMEDDFADLI